MSLYVLFFEPEKYLQSEKVLCISLSPSTISLMVVVTNVPILSCTALHVSKLRLSDEVRFGICMLASVADPDLKYKLKKGTHFSVNIYL